ncbi:MAG: response regulator transcription factor [Anaerolineae bacterium]|nr:response regulator transcription factor [Anaerolineae bacterium]
MSEPLRVLLVDDHILFRRGVQAVLASRPDMEVVGEAGDGFEALALARETMPDVILMDISMPGCDGLEATRRIKQELPYVKVFMLTVSDADEHLFEALKSGAQGYLTKDLKAQQLFDALEGVARGEAAFSGAMAAKILREFDRTVRGANQDLEATDPLTGREREVLQLVAQGKSNQEIAEALVISESTVKNHLRNILGKLHLRNRIEAAVYAVRQGLVEDPPQR